jgi:hypothetical protein
MAEAQEYVREVDADIEAGGALDWFNLQFEDGSIPFYQWAATCSVPEVEINTAQPNVINRGNSLLIGAGTAGGTVEAAMRFGLLGVNRFRFTTRFKGDGVNLVDADFSTLEFKFEVVLNDVEHQIKIRLFSSYGVTEEVQYQDSGFAWEPLTDLEWPTLDSHVWHTLAFDVDLGSKLLERVRVDDQVQEVQAAYSSGAGVGWAHEGYIKILLTVANTTDQNQVFFDHMKVEELT